MIVRRFFPRIEIRDGGHEDAMRVGANGRNNGFRIWVWNRIECPAAVAAQELYEWAARWRWNILLLVPGVKRLIEIKSHEIEVQAAARLYGRNPAAYRAHEAGGMLNYPWLKGMTQAEIYAAMCGQAVPAAKWVKRHWPILLKIREAAA